MMIMMVITGTQPKMSLAGSEIGGDLDDDEVLATGLGLYGRGYDVHG